METSRASRWPAAVLLALALALRLHGIETESVWFDEVSAIDNARAPLGQFLPRLVRTETNPPLYFLLLRGWIALAGDGAASIRLLSVAGDLLGLVLLFRLGGELLGPRGAHVALLLGAFSPFEIYYAQEARMYAWHLACCTGSMLYFWRGLRTGARRDHWLWVGFSLAAVYVHLFGWLLLIGQAAHLLALRRAPLAPRVRGMLLVGLAFLPWFAGATVPQMALRAGQWWPGRPGVQDYYHLLWRFAGGSKPLVLLFCGLAAAGLALAWRDRRRAPLDGPALLLVWLGLPLLIWLHGQVLTPVFVAHYFVFCLPALWLLVALGIERLPRPAGLAALALALALVAPRLVEQARTRQKYPWKQIVAVLRESPVKRVEVTGGMSPLLYYDRRDRLGLAVGTLLEGQIRPRFLAEAELAGKLGDTREFWLVITPYKPVDGLDRFVAWVRARYELEPRHPAGLYLCRRRKP